MVYLLSAAIGVAVLLLGEQLKPNETKITYQEKGYNWNNVLIFSFVFGLIGGLLSTWGVLVNDVPGSLNPFLLPFVISITSYITAQSFLTDLRTLLINRKILRVAYISTYIVSLYNVLSNEMFRPNLYPLALFTLFLIVIFLFIPVGPSDVRMMAVAMPYTISIGGYDGILLLVLSLGLVAIGMTIHRNKKVKKELEVYKVTQAKLYKEFSKKDFNRTAKKVIRQEFNTSEEHAVAVGPYMLLPFLIYLLAYPLL